MRHTAIRRSHFNLPLFLADDTNAAAATTTTEATAAVGFPRAVSHYTWICTAFSSAVPASTPYDRLASEHTAIPGRARSCIAYDRKLTYFYATRSLIQCGAFKQTHLPAYSAPFGGMMNSYNTKSALGISPSGTFGTPDSAIGSMGMSPGFGMNSGGGGMGMGAPSGGLPPLLSFAKRGVSKKQAASVPQPSPPAVLPHRSSTTPTMSPSSPGTPGRMAARLAGSLGMPSPASPLSPITTTQGCAVEALAREQAFDGSFAVSQRLLLLTTKQDRPPKMPTTLDALALAADVKAAVWCTLICVAFLHTKLAAERDVWGIIGDKALEWVKETLGGVDFGEGESVEVLVEEWKQAGIKFVR